MSSVKPVVTKSHSGQEIDPALGERFSALLDRMGLAGQSDSVYPVLVDHYSEESRYYHRLGHIQQCLGVIDEIRNMLHDPEAVELAIWFHDVVFDPAGDDNELRSALFFDRYLGVRLPTERADEIHGMIMTTIHPSRAESHDARFVADVDISGLALPWPNFFEDTKSLRREAAHLTEERFRTGKLGFFKQLLSRSSIYLTEYFRDNYEEQARRNILTLCDEMEKEDGGITPRLRELS